MTNKKQKTSVADMPCPNPKLALELSKPRQPMTATATATTTTTAPTMRLPLSRVLPRLRRRREQQQQQQHHHTQDDSETTMASTAFPTFTSLERTMLQPQERERRVVCQCCFEEEIAIPFVSGEDNSNSDKTSWVACTHASSSTNNSKSNNHHYICTHCLIAYVNEWVFGGSSYALLAGIGDTSSRSTSSTKSYRLRCVSPDCKDGYLSERAIRQTVSSQVMEHYTNKMQQQQQQVQQRTTTTTLPLLFSSANHHQDDATSRTTTRVEETCLLSASTTATMATSSTAFSVQSIVEEKCRKAEEALTEARVRKCAVCSTQFIKENDSCNKMRCPSCGYAMCYLCHAEISPNKQGYDHFCSHRYDRPCDTCLLEKGNKCCVLWQRPEEEEQREGRRLRELAQELANRVWEESLLLLHEHGEEEGEGRFCEEIRLDVERLLQHPTADNKRSTTQQP